MALSNIPVSNEAYDRFISITVAVFSLVLGVLPLIGFVVNLILRILNHEYGMPSLLILFFPAGLIGVSITISRSLRRGEVLHWLGPGALNYVLLLLMVALGVMILAETRAIERLMIRWIGLNPNVAKLLAVLPIIAGGLVFVFYWRKASVKRVRQ